MINSIMCVDDDPIALLVAGSCIKKSGITENVIKMESAQDALDYFRNMKDETEIPSIIFLDLNMPVMDGWGFLKTITEEFPMYKSKTKVIILSSSVDPEDKLKAQQNDWVHTFLPKPIGVELLIEVTNSLF